MKILFLPSKVKKAVTRKRFLLFIYEKICASKFLIINPELSYDLHQLEWQDRINYSDSEGQVRILSSYFLLYLGREEAYNSPKYIM